jgi:hypothetical protein
MERPASRGEPCAEDRPVAQSRPGTGRWWLSRLESRSPTRDFGRPRAPGVRNPTDNVWILCRMTREPAPSGGCRFASARGWLWRVRRVTPSIFRDREIATTERLRCLMMRKPKLYRSRIIFWRALRVTLGGRQSPFGSSAASSGGGRLDRWIKDAGRIADAGKTLSILILAQVPWLFFAPDTSYGWQREGADIIIERGDTLWMIAAAHVGGGHLYTQLLQQCPPDRPLSNVSRIRPGLRLRCTPSERHNRDDDREQEPNPFTELIAVLSTNHVQLADELKGIRNDIGDIFCHSNEVDGSIPASCKPNSGGLMVPPFLGAIHAGNANMAHDIRSISGSLFNLDRLDDLLVKRLIDLKSLDNLLLMRIRPLESGGPIFYFFDKLAVPILVGAAGGIVLLLLTPHIPSFQPAPRSPVSWRPMAR